MQKKKSKKIKKFNNTIIASFQAKIVWKRTRKREIKVIVSFRPYLTRNWKFQKNCKKILKIKHYHYGSILSQNRWKEDQRGRKKKLSFHSVPIRRGIENAKKKSKKINKIKKYHYGIISGQNSLETPRKREIENYGYVQFLADAL